ncbi:MAG: TraR/DksA C4-type zinc finger protein [Acidimicrobiia bacterium]|nr:TraR/DksA C4-type zinc finger protein [Acidimicrobiia bacterium]MDH3462753.1 TraR/DksA C4-type zinc finger protein [Acidimicrobiia bacterium]
MARKLAKSTVERFRKRLVDERDRLEAMVAEYEKEREEARLTESSADRSPDPGNAEAGSMKFEYEKELSIEQNLIDLKSKVEAALAKVEAGTYGICERCGEPIPIARLDALPYSTLCVDCARRP